MQTVFRLPWSSEPPGEKIIDKANFNKSHPMPVVDISLLKRLKRKRTDSPESSPYTAHAAKKWKNARGEVQLVGGFGQPDGPVLVNDIDVDVAQSLEENAVTPVSGSKDKAVATLLAEGSIRKEDDKANNTTTPSEVSKPSASADTENPSLIHNKATLTDDDILNPLQIAIKTQIDQEILLKHGELRDIEQELAKCQIALEQLRRCHELQYPGSHSFSEEVSAGVGPALRPPPGYSIPESPAPWGVADGPYSRQYAQWLIPSPRFDSYYEPNSRRNILGRATRASNGNLPLVDDFLDYPPARNSRNSTGTRVLDPPEGLAKDRLVLKRSTDGKLVKLFCTPCNSDDYKNVQGFLNHCRIKHKLHFASQDQAAIQCGIPLDEQPPVAEPSTAKPPAEIKTPATATAPAPVSAPPPAPTTLGQVHPLILSMPARKETARILPPQRRLNRHSEFSAAGTPEDTRMTGTPGSFEPSPLTPHMNALLKKHGFSGDLSEMVREARTKIDLDTVEVLPEQYADISNQGSKTSASRKPKETLAPIMSSTERCSPSLSINGNNRETPRRPPHLIAPTAIRPSRSPAFPSPAYLDDEEVRDRVIPESPTELSPNGVESNPGLVSDHDDEDDEDADAQSEVLSKIEGDDEFVLDDVLVEDGSDVERTGRKGMSGFKGAVKAGSSRKG